LIRRPWRRLKRAAKALRKDLPDIRWHAVRIRARRCCYAAEAIAPVVGCQAGRFAVAIAAVQAIPGDHQDTVMAGAWLRATGAAVSQTCIAAGRRRRLALRTRTCGHHGEGTSTWECGMLWFFFATGAAIWIALWAAIRLRRHPSLTPGRRPPW